MSQAPGNWLSTIFQTLKSDRALPLLAILGMLGFALYWVMEPRVFPSASIDLKLSRGQITEMARGEVDRLGYNRSKAIESTTFTYSNGPKTFLEHQLGAVRANELMKDKIPIWSWTTRYCKEFDLEQCRIWLSPLGKMTAFERTFEDERAMPSLSRDAAKKMAADFILKESGVDVTNFKLAMDKSTTRAHRDDFSFNWEDQSVDYKGGYLQYFVQISGNTVTSYSETLKVPEKWTREYAKLRTVNDLLEQIASIFYEPMQFLAYLAVPLALSRGLMRYRVAIFGGALMAFIGVTDSINDFASVVDSYNPTTAFHDYLTTYYLGEVFSIVGTFLSGACLFGGCDVIYRMAFPQRVALEKYLSLDGFKSAEGLKGVLVGYCVCAMHLGWIIAYYLIGDKLGFWCPLGLDAYQTLGTSFPFFSAISLGVHASWQEETAARVVALSLMKKLTGNFWVANIFQAAAWGFMHSTYPQQPAYARGIELTLGGLFYGWILRRYGLIPCLLGHYLVDAFLDVKPLFASGNPTLVMSAFIPIVPFALLFIAACFSIRKSGVPATETIANESLPVPPAAEKVDAVQEEPFHYVGLSKWSRILWGTVGSLMMLFAIWSHIPSPGDDKRLHCSQTQAITTAKGVLQANGVDPKDYMVDAKLTSSLASHQLQYVFEKVGRKRTEELAAAVEPGYLWQVRFFRILDPREFTVEVGSTGKEYNCYVVEEEDAPGKRLKSDEARAKAVAYMQRVHPEFKDVVVDKVSLEARKNRDDWTVQFSTPSLKIGDADFRQQVSVIGDWVCNYDQDWKIPDAWQQKRDEENGVDLVLTMLRKVMWIVVYIAVLILFFQVLKAGRLPWKAGIFIAVGCGALILCEQLNHLPALYSSYETSQDRQTFLVSHGLEVLSTSVTTMLTYFISAAFLLALYRRVKPPAPVPAILVTALRPPNRAAKLVQERIWIDGIIIGLLWVSLSLCKSEISGWLFYWYSPEITTAQIYIIDSLPDFWDPVASDVLELATSYLTLVAGILIMVALAQKHAPRFDQFFTYMVIYVLISSSNTRHLSDYFISITIDVFFNTLLWLIIVRLARFNPVVYLVKIVLEDSVPFLYGIWVFAWPIFLANFISFAFYLLGPIFVLTYVHVRNRTEKEKPEAPFAETPVPIPAPSVEPEPEP